MEINQKKELSIENIKELDFHEQYDYLNKFVDHNISNVNDKNITKEEKNIFSKANEKLDKYYTKPIVAKKCYESVLSLLELVNKDYNKENILFIEPSAGSGVFLDIINEEKLGFDIAPSKESNHVIQKNDFLKDDLVEKLNEKQKQKKIIFIGNPPFGTKAKLAIDFVNKSLSYGNVVAFIVPIQFRKWSVQSKLNKSANLILDLDLQENAFEFMGKDYKVRCCFQVWVSNNFNEFNNIEDLKIKEKPATKHPDFEMYQFNRTEEAKKFFDYEWDFAVPRQGYLDYTIKALKKEDCDMKQQWIFFKAKNPNVLNNLKNMDFVKLSKKNIGIPGFGKADVIIEYNSLYQ